MDTLRLIIALIVKEFRTEFRQKDFLFSMFFFTVSAILIVNFAIPADTAFSPITFGLIFGYRSCFGHARPGPNVQPRTRLPEL